MLSFVCAVLLSSFPKVKSLTTSNRQPKTIFLISLYKILTSLLFLTYDQFKFGRVNEPKHTQFKKEIMVRCNLQIVITNYKWCHLMHALILSFTTARQSLSNFHIPNYCDFEDIKHINIFFWLEVIKKDKVEVLLCKHFFLPVSWDKMQVLLFWWKFVDTPAAFSHHNKFTFFPGGSNCEQCVLLRTLTCSYHSQYFISNFFEIQNETAENDPNIKIDPKSRVFR